MLEKPQGQVVIIGDWMGNIHAALHVDDDFSDADLQAAQKVADYYNQYARVIDLEQIGNREAVIARVRELNGDDGDSIEEVDPHWDDHSYPTLDDDDEKIEEVDEDDDRPW